MHYKLGKWKSKEHLHMLLQVISGINLGDNVGYSIIYSGTVGGARNAFLLGVPSVSISCSWFRGNCSDNDLFTATRVCMPIINAIVQECRNGTYPTDSFLNINLPTDLSNHKGCKVTRQAESIFRDIWTRTSEDGTIASVEEIDHSVSDHEDLWFIRTDGQGNLRNELDDDDDIKALKEGYITITPLSALSNTTSEVRSYFTERLQSFCNIQN